MYLPILVVFLFATYLSAAQEVVGRVETRSPTSSVKGKAFDRLAIIWLENTNYEKAVGDPHLALLARKGITLTNNYGVTHPSQPNYVAAIGGDYFGMDKDSFYRIPQNVSTVIDLLEAAGVSWGEYQEDMPYTGFTGKTYLNQQNGANDYVRRHNPAVIYDANVDSNGRLGLMKNLTMFYHDLDANTLPQWMFITPNMSSNGHDTSVTTAGDWTYNFLNPLLDDDRFMNNTLVLITFDENDNRAIANRVLGILLGDAVPPELVGTEDDNFYNHYSEISTVEANWGLDTLGRWDVGANVYSFVAEKTGDMIRKWSNPPLEDMGFNSPYPGPLNNETPRKWPPPNTSAIHAGRKVLQKIIDTWEADDEDTYYTTGVETMDGRNYWSTRDV